MKLILNKKRVKLIHIKFKIIPMKKRILMYLNNFND